jgi:membrane associated rhomboid family serine protease
MRTSAHTIGQEIHGVLVFVGAIWVVSLVALFIPWLKLRDFGLVPRTVHGLWGIVTMPFLHASLGHLIANTIPLMILLVLLAGSRAESWEIVVATVLLSGGLLWVCGRTADHIGASALIFGLAFFLILAGFFEKRIVPLIIALIVGFFYGTSLVFGLIPKIGSSISWDGHLCGAIAGGLIAYLLTHESRTDRQDAIAPKSRFES